MKTKLVTKLVCNMSSEEIGACRLLHLDRESRLKDDLEFHLQMWRSKAHAIMVKDHLNAIMAWGLIDYSDGKYPVVQLYTHPDHRRKGLGTRIMQRAKRLLGDSFVTFGHDPQSVLFFSTQGIQDPRFTNVQANSHNQ